MPNSNILYYEPNYTNFAPSSGSVNQYNIKPFAPPLEDYSVVVDLEVEVPVRPLYGEIKAGSSIIYIRYSSSVNGDSSLTFNQGRKYQGSTHYYITTEPSEMGTFNDISRTESPSTEMFGINSIDIEYNNFMVPIVTIQFTDIRGLSLFGAEDLRHNVTSQDGIAYSANNDIAGSFFKCFFSFPYPKFKIMVKGFYGNPVSYELTCSDFRASFDSSTGNFGATAKFVGYSFSVLNDLTLTSLLSSPYSEYYGKKYWENNAQRFVFDDGRPMMKLLDLLDTIKNIEKKLPTNENDETLQNLQNNLNKLMQIKECHQQYYLKLTEIVRKQGGNNSTSFIEGPNFRIATKFSINSNELNEAYKKLIAAINSLGTISKVNSFGVVNCNNIANTAYEVNDETFEAFKKISGSCYAYDGSSLANEIENKQNEYTQNIKTRENELNKNRNELIENLIGFKPSVKNVTELILAHVDTFINELYVCGENVSRLPKTSNTRNNLKKENTLDEGFYAFPLVISRPNNKDGVMREERTWIGEYDISAPEAQLVESLLNATDKAESIVNAAPNSSTVANNTLGLNVEIPTTPIDFIGNSNPYSNIDFKNNDDFFGKILIRALLVNNSVIYTDRNVVKEIGKADALNFYKNNKIVSDSFASMISPSGGTLTSDAVISWLQGKRDNSETDAIWNTVNHQSNGLMKVQGQYYYTNFFTSQNKTQIPISNFDWDDLSNTIGKTVNLLPYYTQGFAVKNENCFYVDKNWKKYYQYNTVKPDNNSELLASLYNFQIDGNELANFYSTILKYASMVGNTVKSLSPNTVIEDFSQTSQSSIKTIEIKDIKLTTLTTTELVNSYSTNLDNDNLTLRYFCGYKDGYISNEISIFGQSDYYQVLNNLGDEAAALMFLSTFNWNYDEFFDLLLNQNIFYAPYLFIITLGGYYYRLDNPSLFKYSNVKTNDFKGKDNQYSILGVNKNFNKDVFSKISVEIKETLKKLFIDWVKNEFKAINSQFAINVSNDSFKTADKFITDIVTKYQSKNNKIFQTAKSLKDYLKNNLSSNFIENYSQIQFCLTSKKLGLKILNREDSSFIQSITNNLIEPCVVINAVKNPIKGLNQNSENPNYINANVFRLYIDGLIEGLRTNYSQDVAIASNNDNTTSDSIKEVKIALYNYLKTIWDKWISGNPKINGKTIWDLENLKERWHYLDSFYNKLTDDAIIDVFALKKDISNAYETIGSSALSVMSSTYARSRYWLMCVQNFVSMTDEKFMKDMFNPIPFNKITADSIKALPDFIVMYTNEPSSKLDISNGDYKDDSFLIGGDDMQLPIPIKTKNLQNGYKIPAFGVTYGSQYQSYFTNIQVGMEKPQVTDQSLQARFSLAQSALHGESGGEGLLVGQDLFTIYANQSYTCTVEMLGCAWVQPLMYFQLNNIPMFKGSYLIYRVTHNISQGMMTTKFVGMRMSKLSTPLVSNGLLLNPNNQTQDTSELAEIAENKMANIRNNCSYKFFTPIIDVSNVGMPINELEMTVKDYGDKHNGWLFNMSTKLNKTMAQLFADIAASECGINADDLSVKLVLSVLFNRYMSSGKNFCKVLKNASQHDLTKEYTNDSYLTAAKEIFTKTPLILVGKRTTVLRNLPIWNFSTKSNKLSSSKTLTAYDVKTIDSYCSILGYDTTFRVPRNEKNVGANAYPLEPIPPSKKAIWHNGKFIVQHDMSKVFGHVFTSVGFNSTKAGVEHWKSQTTTKTNQNTTDLPKNLVNSIKQTINFSDDTTVKEIKVNYKLINDNTIEIETNSLSGNAQVFDIVLNTYYDYFSELLWIADNNTNSLPSSVQIVVDDTNSRGKIIGVASKNNNKIGTIINQYNDLNELFYISLKKRYDIITNENASRFKTECKNFTSLINTENWMETVNKLLNKDIQSCNPIGNSIDGVINDSVASGGKTYSWDGQNCNQNKNTPQPAINTYNKEKAGLYAKNNCPNSTKNCAKYVRLAIYHGGGLQIKNYPLSACCYVKHLPVWGFKCVYSGVVNYGLGSFQPENGDIIVISGIKNTDNDKYIHGHIQIFYKDKWYSDFETTNPVTCSGSKEGRPFKVFRWKS